jgi:hypothetical protein
MSDSEYGLSASAVEIGRVFGFPITNSMVVSWAVALGLIVFVRFATRRMDQPWQALRAIMELINNIAKLHVRGCKEILDGKPTMYPKVTST